jgi:hypothetical protein
VFNLQHCKKEGRKEGRKGGREGGRKEGRGNRNNLTTPLPGTIILIIQMR